MEEVEAKFLTALPERYQLSASTFSLPVSITAEGLNQLIAQQVALTEKLIFTLNNVLITATLEETMTQLRLTGESLLEIWYSLAVPLPETTATQSSPDWVSALSFLSPASLVACDYSGAVTVFADCQPVSTTALHSFPIKCVAVAQDRGFIATGGKDGSLKVSVFARGDWELKAEGKLKSVEALAWNPTGTMVAAGLFCGEVHIASINTEETAMLTKASKRQKLSAFGLRTQRLNVPHSDCLSSLHWPELGILYTASHDHSVIVWDVASESAVFSYTAPRSIQAFDVSERLVACGFENGEIKVVDERSAHTVASLVSQEFVRVLKWRNHALISGHESGEMKVWDVRANAPLESGKKHSDKILAIASAGDIIATGGADCEVQFHRFQS